MISDSEGIGIGGPADVNLYEINHYSGIPIPLKRANVVPVFKTKTKLNLSRPISSNSIVTRLLPRPRFEPESVDLWLDAPITTPRRH